MLVNKFPSWSQFEAQVADWMKTFARSDLIFKAGFQSIPGFPSDGFRADALLTNNRTLLAVEVEVRQSHPDTNVGKYWILSEHYKYDKVILFHIYTPGYNSYGWRKKLGEFYAKKMASELPFEYILLDQTASKDSLQSFKDICAVIEPRIYEEFYGGAVQRLPK